jgi:hypothetical protein
MGSHYTGTNFLLFVCDKTTQLMHPTAIGASLALKDVFIETGVKVQLGVFRKIITPVL